MAFPVCSYCGHGRGRRAMRGLCDQCYMAAPIRSLFTTSGERIAEEPAVQPDLDHVPEVPRRPPQRRGTHNRSPASPAVQSDLQPQESLPRG